MSDVQVPHFAFPVSLAADGSFAVVEQDSAEEITQCVAVLLSTVVEQREELPLYGIVDPTFSAGIDIGEILDAVANWEPRATAGITAEVDSVDELMQNIYVAVSAQTA